MGSPGGPLFTINYYCPSEDGRYVAYGVSPGGSEQAVLRILDIHSNRDTGETIDRVRFGPISWLPDGRLLYNRLQKLSPGAPPSEKYLKSRDYVHVVGTDPETDLAVFGYDVSPSVKVEPPDISFVLTPPGSEYAIGLIRHGVQRDITVYVAPRESIGKPDAPWRKACDIDDQITDFTLRVSDLYLLTHKDASRFNVIRSSAATPRLS